jgi:hypothetical protein
MTHQTHDTTLSIDMFFRLRKLLENMMKILCKQRTCAMVKRSLCSPRLEDRRHSNQNRRWHESIVERKDCSIISHLNRTNDVRRHWYYIHWWSSKGHEDFETWDTPEKSTKNDVSRCRLFIVLFTSWKCCSRNSFVDDSTWMSTDEFCRRTGDTTVGVTVVVKYRCTADTVAFVSLLQQLFCDETLSYSCWANISSRIPNGSMKIWPLSTENSEQSKSQRRNEM